MDQKSKNQEILQWIKSQLKHGYIRQRNDGMTEYTIVGLKEVDEVLKLLLPRPNLHDRNCAETPEPLKKSQPDYRKTYQGP